MAINLITQPGATTPIGNDDYTQQNLLINGALAQGDEVLTSWADTVTEPSIAQGTYFYHSGNLYQVDSADEAISGTIASGVNYIVLSVSGTTLTASYTTSLTGYTFNPAYNGLYNGTDLVIKAVTYLIGTANIRGTSINKTMDGMFMLSDGSFVTSAGQFNLGNKDVVTTGDISSSSLTTTGGISFLDGWTTKEIDFTSTVDFDWTTVYDSGSNLAFVMIMTYNTSGTPTTDDSDIAHTYTMPSSNPIVASPRTIGLSAAGGSGYSMILDSRLYGNEIQLLMETSNYASLCGVKLLIFEYEM